MSEKTPDVKYSSAPSEPPPSYEKANAASSSKPPPLRAPLPLLLPSLQSLRGRRVILASSSPRRKHLLGQLGLSIEIIPSTVPEAFSKDLDPFDYVLQTATQKALTIYTQEVSSRASPDPALVIAADTIILSSLGQILEKPTSEAHHISMLRQLRDGGMHKVFTAVAVMAPLESARDPGYALETTVEETTVRFDRGMSDEMILAYVRTREGADKAGGYGIQGVGAVLVERIEGSWDNVVGLPLKATLGLIERVLRGDYDDGSASDEEE